MSVEDIQKLHIRDINIWITASGCSGGKEGQLRYILQYGNGTKFGEEMLSGATANQAYIQGAIHAVRRITGSFRICIIVPTALGFEKGFRGKGVNGELIGTLYEEIAKRGCTLTEVRYLNGADVIKKYIAQNADNTKYADELERKQNEKQNKKQNKKLQYEMKIYKECLVKVCRILEAEGIDNEILEKINKIKPY